MCFGGPKAPSVAAAPVADPIPSPSPADETPSQTAEAKRKKIAQMQMGLASTIKSGASGVESKAPLLSPTLMGVGLKDKLGK